MSDTLFLVMEISGLALAALLVVTGIVAHMTAWYPD